MIPRVSDEFTEWALIAATGGLSGVYFLAAPLRSFWLALAIATSLVALLIQRGNRSRQGDRSRGER